MRFLDPLVPGILVRRYKRFLADVELADGTVVTAHCANSGAMTTCAEPGWRVLLSPAHNPKRKLRWTWEIVYAPDAAVLVNTARPNHVVREGVEQGFIPELSGYATVRGEVPYGEGSRIDLLLRDPGDCYVEVKSVTLLAEPGVGAFPDAVTTRGRKHLVELTRQVEAGDRAVQLFLVPRGDIEVVRPADEIDPDYGRQLRLAAAAGVEVTAWRARVSPEGVEVEKRLPVDL